MTALENILPDSLVPAKYKAEYETIKKILYNSETIWTGAANKRIKDAIIADMADILDAVDRNKIKKERLQEFKRMVENIHETKKSTIYTQHNYSSWSEDTDNWRYSGWWMSSSE